MVVPAIFEIYILKTHLGQNVMLLPGSAHHIHISAPTSNTVMILPTNYNAANSVVNALIEINTDGQTEDCFRLKDDKYYLVEWSTSKNFKIVNTQFQKKAGRRWTWRSPDGNTKNEIYYIMTDKPSMVTEWAPLR